MPEPSGPGWRTAAAMRSSCSRATPRGSRRATPAKPHISVARLERRRCDEQRRLVQVPRRADLAIDVAVRARHLLRREAELRGHVARVAAAVFRLQHEIEVDERQRKEKL